MTVWVHNQVADTDRFVATMSPLIREPAVQAAVVDRVTDTVFGYVDVQALATDAVKVLFGTLRIRRSIGLTSIVS